jgi:hypothetical protein
MKGREGKGGRGSIIRRHKFNFCIPAVKEKRREGYILEFLRFPLHIIIPWRWVWLAGCGIELSVYLRIEKEDFGWDLACT